MPHSLRVEWQDSIPYLRYVRAVIAESFERIHRSNLVGMGTSTVPLQFKDGHASRVESLGLTGKEEIDIVGLSDDLKPRQDVTVKATKDDGSVVEFKATVRIDTPVEVEYYRNGGTAKRAYGAEEISPRRLTTACRRRGKSRCTCSLLEREYCYST